MLREAAESEACAELYQSARRDRPERRPYISAIMLATGYGRAKVVRLLQGAGIDPSREAWRARTQ